MSEMNAGAIYGISKDEMNTFLKTPGDIGGTTPAAGTFSPLKSKGPAAITTFAGTVSTAGASTTITFSSAADAILAGYSATNPILGATLISNALTRYIMSWTNATTCVVNSDVTWAGTAITSVQLPIEVFVDSSGAMEGRISNNSALKKFNGVVNAAEYPTLQAAADAAGIGGRLYIPQGTYTNGIALTSIHNGLTLEGAGYGSYIQVATGSAITVTGTSGAHATDIKIKNVRLDYQSGSYGIYAIYADRLEIESPYFTVDKAKQIYISFCSDYTIKGAKITGSDTKITGTAIQVYESSPFGKIIDNNIVGNFDYHIQLSTPYSAPPATITVARNILSGGTTLSPTSIGIHVGPGIQALIVDNSIYNCDSGIITDVIGIQQVIGNFFHTCALAIYSGGGETIFSHNVFIKCNSIISNSDNYNVKWGENYIFGGTMGITNPISNSVIGDLITIASNPRLGNAGTNCGWFLDYHTFYDGDSATSFANVQASDILVLNHYAIPTIFKIKSVTDNQHLVIDGVSPVHFTDGIAYQIFRNVAVTTGNGSIWLPLNGVLSGAHRLKESVISAAVSSGSVAIINSAPTIGGIGYAVGDLSQLTDGSSDAIVQVLTVAAGVVQTVGLIDSGSYGYTTGTGKVTTHLTGSGSGLTVNISAVGLSVAQVSDTILTNTGQASVDITNYLPTAKAGYKFSVLLSTTQAAKLWALANNSGIANNVSGDVMSLVGVDGIAGSAHGIKDTVATKGDRLDCYSVCVDSTNSYYQWACHAPITVGVWAAY